MSAMSLEALEAFVRAGELRSFVAAGRRLGVTASAIGKSVARLEASLGVRLMNRTTRSVALTDEGAALFRRGQRILGELDDAEAELSATRQRPRGRLRVSFPAAGFRLLAAKLPSFVRAYPELELDVDYSDRLVDVIEDGFDVVVRSGPLVDSALRSRKVGSFRMRVVAAPSYLRRARTPATPAELARHACLMYRFPTTGKLQPWRLATAAEPRPAMTCNSVEALLAAACDGIGLAYLPDFVVASAITARRLRPVLASAATEVGSFHALWPEGRLLAARVRVFLDAIAR